MKRSTPTNLTLACALLSLIAAGQALAATFRYQGSGDYTNLLAIHGLGWYDPAVPGSPTILPGSADLIRANYGSNTITLTTVAPTVRNFQLGVDESGHLLVESGGKLTTTGAANSTVGNNAGSAGVVGALTVNTGGEVIATNVLFVGNSGANNVTGILTVNGGRVRSTTHLWAGSGASTTGFIYITNGGTVTVGGNIGLGTINASSASGSTASLFVQEGGVLNLSQMNSISTGTGGSIQAGSKLDISGSGVVIIVGDQVSKVGGFTNAARITAYGGAGTVGVDYNNTNVGKTTLWAIAPPAPPATNAFWTATSGAGIWNVGANWDVGAAPLGVTRVNFNVPGAIPCTVTTTAAADYLVMGENGPGGTLIITNGGALNCGVVGTNVIGLNSNALMVVETSASASFPAGLRIGLDTDSDGTLVMNGGTVTVSGQFDLGGNGGKGTAQIKGGQLKLAQLDGLSISFNSLLDVTGTGQVLINGDVSWTALGYVGAGMITNSVGTNVIVDYNLINVGKTTIYPAGLYLPPAQVVWDPASNPSSTGLWDECANWTGGLCPSNVTIVTFKTPDAIPCTLTNAGFASTVKMGNGGPGGTLIITNGGSLTTTDTVDWNSIGMNNTGLVVVATGSSASYGNHLWVGYEPVAEGTLIVDGGTVSVGGQLGLGWNGGKGTAQINGGTLNLANIHPTDSIKGSSVLNLTGTGKVLITGNQVTAVSNYIAAAKITANGGAGTVVYGYDPGLNKTILQVAPPTQSITGVSVSGGDTTITYQTTPGRYYHIESSPTLSPATWTRVTGSTTNATGSAVLFTFPSSGDQRFYRTVAP